MRLGAGSGRHAHERNDHPLAFDAAAFDRGIAGAALDMIDTGKIEQVFARAGALGAWGPCRRVARHLFLLGARTPPARKDTNQAVFITPDAAASPPTGLTIVRPLWAASIRQVSPGPYTGRRIVVAAGRLARLR